MTLTDVNSALRIPFLSTPLNNDGVQQIEQIYRERLGLLVQKQGKGRQSILSGMIGKSPAQISQWINASKDSKTGEPRAMDRSTAREIEKALKLPLGWMDQPVTQAERAIPGGELIPQLVTEPQNTNGTTTLETIGVKLSRADEGTRKLAAAMLAEYATDPANKVHVLRALNELLKPFEDDDGPDDDPGGPKAQRPVLESDSENDSSAFVDPKTPLRIAKRKRY